jgi:hypothetical protein
MQRNDPNTSIPVPFMINVSGDGGRGPEIYAAGSSRIALGLSPGNDGANGSVLASSRTSNMHRIDLSFDPTTAGME